MTRNRRKPQKYRSTESSVGHSMPSGSAAVALPRASDLAKAGAPGLGPAEGRLMENFSKLDSLLNETSTTPTIAKPGASNRNVRTPDSAEEKSSTQVAVLDSASLETVVQRLADEWSRVFESKISGYESIIKAQECERIEIERLREQLQSAIATAEARVASQQGEHPPAMEELERRVIDVQEENVRLANLLHHSRQEYHTLLHFIETERLSETFDAKESDGAELTRLREQNQFLQDELEALRNDAGDSAPDAESRLQIEQLRSQLLHARSESVELRLQTEELSARLAKFQGPDNSQRGEALSWEERKCALLNQLEAETHSDAPCDPRKVLDIERIVDETSREISRKDEEIQDLRALLAQQSVMQDGLAIGAAALADVVEADALIVSERLRLKELQSEWEQKQRQAEIEMSLERAKLARERLELQERMRDLEQGEGSGDSEKSQPKSDKGKSRGRWLTRLGLRDE